MTDDVGEIVGEIEDLIYDRSLDRARDELDRARRTHGDRARFDALEAEIAFEDDRFQRAGRAAEAGLDRVDEGEDELRAQLWALKGDALFYADREEEARRAFNRAVACDSQLWTAVVGRATVHEHLGYLRAATLDLDRAIEREPDAPEPRAIRGSVHLQRGELEAAQRDLRRAVEIDPSDAASRLDLARIGAYQGARSEAIDTLDPLLNDGGAPADVALPAALLRSQLRVDLGDHEAARRDAERAAELAPDQPWSYLQLAAVRIAAGEPGGAVGALEEAEERIEQPRDVPDLFALRASARRHLGEREKAERAQTHVEGVARLPAVVYGEALNPAADVPIDPDQPFDVRRVLEQLFGDPDAAPEGYEQKLRELLGRVPEIVDEHPGAGEIEIELPPVEEGGGSPGQIQLQVGE